MPRLRLLLALIALAGALLAAERALAQAQTQESEQDQAAQVVFAVPPAPMHDGLFRFLVPRFSLKTGVPVRVVALAPDGAPPADAGVVLAPAPGPAQSEATPLLADAAGQRYVLYVTAPRTRVARRLADWLLSATGRRTVAQFRLDGRQAYFPLEKAAARAGGRRYGGDAARGERMAYAACGRCHVIGERNRMKGIGSTPSFGALRALGNWRERFETFFARNPHPAIVQLEGVTPPFAAATPPPMAPVVITRAQFDDILSFVEALTPADLGAPIRHQ